MPADNSGYVNAGQNAVSGSVLETIKVYRRHQKRKMSGGLGVVPGTSARTAVIAFHSPQYIVEEHWEVHFEPNAGQELPAGAFLPPPLPDPSLVLIHSEIDPFDSHIEGTDKYRLRCTGRYIYQVRFDQLAT